MAQPTTAEITSAFAELCQLISGTIIVLQTCDPDVNAAQTHWCRQRADNLRAARNAAIEQVVNGYGDLALTTISQTMQEG